MGRGVAFGVGLGEAFKYLDRLLYLAFGLFVFVAFAVQKGDVEEQASEQLKIGSVLALGLLGEEVERGCGSGCGVVHVAKLDVHGCEYLHEGRMEVEGVPFGRRGKSGDGVGYGGQSLDGLVGLAMSHHLCTVYAQIVIGGVEVGIP